MKKLLSIMVIAAVLMSFQGKKAADSPQTTKSQLALNNSLSITPVAVSAGTYVGTVPCADCQGIKMKLTLQDSKPGKSRTFLLEQTYMGKPANSNTLQIKGIWIPARGNKQNPDAVVVQLIPNGNYDPLYFLQVNEGAIKMLDRNQNPIQSKHNYTLQKQRQ